MLYKNKNNKDETRRTYFAQKRWVYSSQRTYLRFHNLFWKSVNRKLRRKMTNSAEKNIIFRFYFRNDEKNILVQVFWGGVYQEN